MSTNTSAPPTRQETAPPLPSTTPPSAPPAPPATTSSPAPPATTSSTTQPTPPSTTRPPPPPTTASTTHRPPPDTTRNTVIVVTRSRSDTTVTRITTSIISTANPQPTPSVQTTSTTPSSTPTVTDTPRAPNTSDGESSGLNGTAKVVIAVVVPIVGVALIAIALLFFWKKRRRDKENTEKRRKEVEDYRYNPNSSPGMMSGAATSSNGEATPYDMIEDSVGYRGWGSTNGGRKVSNMGSSVGTAQPLSPVGLSFPDGTYQEASGNPYMPTSPGGAPSTDGNTSNAPLINTPPGNRPGTADSSIVASMTGPVASGNNIGIRRGISNASSNYSTASHSDQSENGLPPGHYDASQYYGVGVDGGYDDSSNYSGPYQQYAEAGTYGSPPLIRAVHARRNTQIETPTNSHFPQQGNSGIAQNF